jgi:hypothetical protein
VRLYRVDRDVHLGRDVRGVEHLPDTAQDVPFPVAELLHDHRGSVVRCDPRCRDDARDRARDHARHRQPGTEQLTVPAGKFRMAHQDGPQPAALHGERKPALLRLAQLKRLLQ